MYLDALARRIGSITDVGWEDRSLLRIYALLGVVLGDEVGLRDVHDAWAIWRAETRPDHPSLVPFEELTHEVQELDRKYRDAIVLALKEVP